VYCGEAAQQALSTTDQYPAPPSAVHLHQAPRAIPFGEHLESIRPTKAASVTFGASAGAGAGWAFGKVMGGFAGCIGIIILAVAIIFGIGVFARMSTSDSPAGNTSAQPSPAGSALDAQRPAADRQADNEAEFTANCISAAIKAGAPRKVAEPYCECSLEQVKAGRAVNEVAGECTEATRRKLSAAPDPIEAQPAASPAATHPVLSEEDQKAIAACMDEHLLYPADAKTFCECRVSQVRKGIAVEDAERACGAK